MSTTTERLIQVAAVILVLWFGWQLVSQTVVSLLLATHRAQVAEEKLRQLELKGK